jgi:hypothetical protein
MVTESSSLQVRATEGRPYENTRHGMATELRENTSHLLRRFAPPPQRGGQSGHSSATTSRPYGIKRHGSDDASAT